MDFLVVTFNKDSDLDDLREIWEARFTNVVSSKFKCGVDIHYKEAEMFFKDNKLYINRCGLNLASFNNVVVNTCESFDYSNCELLNEQNLSQKFDELRMVRFKIVREKNEEMLMSSIKSCAELVGEKLYTDGECYYIRNTGVPLPVFDSFYVKVDYCINDCSLKEVKN